ncbi:MAG: hypothetical protein IPP13_03965 [Kouleothrix sp.]|jgi:hypothetical protein|nr:hypothetical protein [Kouleothrix sp.]
MQGDFTRNTFTPLKHFRRVLMQQGRVILDADFNEQAAIVLQYLQALAADLIGWHGGVEKGFLIEPGPANDFAIRRGHYYVEGVLCDSQGDTRPLSYSDQPFLKPLADDELLNNLGDPGTRLLVYLDACERHISAVEDTSPGHPTVASIREVALGGPDTASRAQLVWQVKCVPITDAAITAATLKAMGTATEFREQLRKLLGPAKLDRETHVVRPGSGLLRARAFAGTPGTSPDPCTTPPEAGYRGSENRLYRIEIHRPGDTPGAAPNPVTTDLTFKWSRENGSVIFPLRAPLNGDTALVVSLGRDGRLGLAQGDWVELSDDDLALRGQRGPICQVGKVDLQARQVDLVRPTEVQRHVASDLKKHPLLRRWDHRPNQSQPTAAQLSGDDNGLKLVVSSGDEQGWLTLEHGVQVQFQPGGVYYSGDYWLIPARVATGNIEWPIDASGAAAFVLPHGVQHYYAPLAVATVQPDGKLTIEDCRRTINQLWS